MWVGLAAMLWCDGAAQPGSPNCILLLLLLLLCSVFVGLREQIALKLGDLLSTAILSGCLKLQARRPTGFDFLDPEGSCSFGTEVFEVLLLLLCSAFVGLREQIALKFCYLPSTAILSGCLKGLLANWF